MHCRRAGHDGEFSTDAEASVSYLWPVVFDGGFRVREADAETDGKCHRGQARPGAAGGGRTTLIREMRVFPPLAQTVTKNYQRPNDDASVRRVCGICGVQR